MQMIAVQTFGVLASMAMGSLILYAVQVASHRGIFGKTHRDDHPANVQGY